MARSTSYVFKVLVITEVVDGEPTQFAAAVREAIETQLTGLRVVARDKGRLRAGRYRVKIFSAALTDAKTSALVRAALPGGIDA